MVFSNCESKMGDFEPDVDIDEKQAGFKLDKDCFLDRTEIPDQVHSEMPLRNVLLSNAIDKANS